MKKVRSDNPGHSRAGDIFIFVILAILGAFMALPLVFAIGQSLKPFSELFVFPPTILPRAPTMMNFTLLFKLTGNLWVPFSRYLFNSIFVAVVVTVTNVIISSMAAFPLAKYKFPGQKALNEIIVIALLFTSQVTAIMQYMIMAKLGMINTYFALLLPYMATSMGLFLMRQFMSQVPDAIIEAAKIDGASMLHTYWTIVMPSVKPAWLTLMIFAFQQSWGITGYQFIYNESLKTLPTVLNQIASSGIARAGVGAAASVILMLPPIVMFLFAQSNVIETMSHSGIKG